MAVEDNPVLPSSDGFPDYTEMVISAIEVLNEPEGSSKLAISNYIESNYPDLPPTHSTLLSNALEKLEQAGQLALSNGCYSKPLESNGTPAKRGRGRPPKPKGDSIPTVVVPGFPRPRGRPPKSRDPLSPSTEPKKVSSGRPRGRPRKNPDEAPAMEKPKNVSGVKRGRGRPPKAKV